VEAVVPFSNIQGMWRLREVVREVEKDIEGGRKGG
jgi:hypothetical protein